MPHRHRRLTAIYTTNQEWLLVTSSEKSCGGKPGKLRVFQHKVAVGRENGYERKHGTERFGVDRVFKWILALCVPGGYIYGAPLRRRAGNSRETAIESTRSTNLLSFLTGHTELNISSRLSFRKSFPGTSKRQETQWLQQCQQLLA